MVILALYILNQINIILYHDMCNKIYLHIPNYQSNNMSFLYKKLNIIGLIHRLSYFYHKDLLYHLILNKNFRNFYYLL